MTDSFQKSYNEAIFPKTEVEVESLERFIMNQDSLEHIQKANKKPGSFGLKMGNKSHMAIKKPQFKPPFKPPHIIALLDFH